MANPSEVSDLTTNSPIVGSLNADSDARSQKHSRRSTKRKRTKTSDDLTNTPEPSGSHPAPRHRSRSRSLTRPPSSSPPPDVFYVDVVPAPLPKLLLQSPPAPDTTQLLLPSHVSVKGAAPSPDLPSPELAPDDIEDEEYIEYLDFDDRKDIKRYFEPDEPTKPIKIVCKACGAEGEHKTFQCNVKICMTCGVRNEHYTPQCPISKNCFRCGRRGHISASCTNPRDHHARDKHCERCGSGHHTELECPSVWRLYEYMSEGDRSGTMDLRKTKLGLPLGQGGEGYIAEDQWCYNCGRSGHWGDDCSDFAFPHDHPTENSAFSSYVLATGPFFDPQALISAPKRILRDWEIDNARWTENVPDQVGKRGRMRDAERLWSKYQEDEEEEDDWFSRPKGRRAPSPPAANSRRSNGNGKNLSFGDLATPRGGRPSLLERLGEGDDRSRRDSYDHGSSRTSRRRSDHNGDLRDKGWRERDGERRRDNDRDKNRDTGNRPRNTSSRPERGPRYKGGYSQ